MRVAVGHGTRAEQASGPEPSSLSSDQSLTSALNKPWDNGCSPSLAAPVCCVKKRKCVQAAFPTALIHERAQILTFCSF